MSAETMTPLQLAIKQTHCDKCGSEMEHLLSIPPAKICSACNRLVEFHQKEGRAYFIPVWSSYR
jgi:RNA polymerase-binding transcription factor DksA